MASFDAIEILERIFLESAFEGDVDGLAEEIACRCRVLDRRRVLIAVRSSIGPVQSLRYGSR